MIGLNKSDTDPNMLSPLVLAYIGDAVFELLVRERILKNEAVNKLNRKASGIVKASSQSKMYDVLLPILDERELSVLKRGRNAKSNTKAKNQSIIDYRRATGVEALFGYVYLNGDMQRLMLLFEKCIEVVNESQKK